MIARSFSIRVLVDLNSHNHGPQSHKLTLSPDGVKNFMSNVRNLRTIITDGRLWTVSRAGRRYSNMSMAKRPTVGPAYRGRDEGLV